MSKGWTSHSSDWETWGRAWRGICSARGIASHSTTELERRPRRWFRGPKLGRPPSWIRLRGAVANAEAVFTMLADDAAVEDVVFGPDGIAEALAAGAIHISSSTISTGLARRSAEEHRRRDQNYVSAPVFGPPEAAESKRLMVVAGGSNAAVGRCRPLFDAIGRQTFLAGPEPWRANAAKLCGSFMIASRLESFGAANALLRKAGVDPHVFLDVMKRCSDLRCTRTTAA